MAIDWRSIFGSGARYVNAVGGGGVTGPDTKSADVASMEQKWCLIAEVIEGHDAIKRGTTRFLPRFKKESLEKYNRRLCEAPWRPVMNDALENICSRPFTAPITLGGAVSDEMQTFAEDVDGRGSSLNVYARQIFDDAVSMGVALFLVDYTRNVPRPDGRPKTIYDEKLEGQRPFWVQIPPRNLIAVRTQFVRGREIVTHLRFWANDVVAEGFSETCIEQIRQVETREGRVWWSIWQKQENGEFQQTDSGVMSLMTEVPLVIVRTGRQKGVIANDPWTYQLCHVALEYFRALARKNEIENLSGWPVIAGQGVSKPTGEEEVEIGPHVILYAPPSLDGGANSRWEVLGPDAGLVAQIAKGPEHVRDEFSRLALAPTIPKQGVTATASGIDNSRAHAAIEVWAAALKNGLDEGLAFTAKWLAVADTVTANVSTDFAALTGSTDEAKIIGDAQKRGVLSKKTERGELKRRGILAPDWNEDEEDTRLAIEQEGLEPEQPIDPITGEVLNDNGPMAQPLVAAE